MTSFVKQCIPTFAVLADIFFWVQPPLVPKPLSVGVRSLLPDVRLESALEHCRPAQLPHIVSLIIIVYPDVLRVKVRVRRLVRPSLWLGARRACERDVRPALLRWPSGRPPLCAVGGGV